jgi:hypothetical protein
MMEEEDGKPYAVKTTDTTVQQDTIPVASKVEDKSTTVNKNTNGTPSTSTPFTEAFPKIFPPDYSLSCANHYIKPISKDLDAIDSSPLPENERHASLCLAPFSKEFYTATGYSKLQLPDDYLELVRVIVWHNRQRIKMGMNILDPSELEKFLHEEMSQDFSDLGIDIDNFLADLIKIRQEESLAFDIFNNWVKKSGQASNITPTNSNGNSTKETKDTVATTVEPPKPGPTTTPPTNLMRKFVVVNEAASEPLTSLLDKPIILKNKETRHHVHRYDLRIGIKECHSEEEEQKLLQGLLEEFLDTILSADKTITIPPYYELDRANCTFDDLSSKFKISEVESFTRLKRYFSRLGNRNPNTGFVYCSCIIAVSSPHSALMTQVSQILQESKLSLWLRLSEHENVGRIGWLLYSLQDMDTSCLKSILTTLTGCEIGVKWMKVNTD